LLLKEQTVQETRPAVLEASTLINLGSRDKNNPELTITINGSNILMSLVGIQSTSDGEKIWKIKLKIRKRITKHKRVCWKQFVDEDFVPLVWTHCSLV
jgi:hypothetical protein